jgi:ATP-dependent Clp protease ATP-binding subunit ClpA
VPARLGGEWATRQTGATWDGLPRARQEAAEWGDRRVGTQHLLLALLARREGHAQHVLIQAGATRTECEIVLGAIHGSGTTRARRETVEVGDGDQARRVLERAALASHEDVIPDEVLLAALIAERDHGLAGAVFRYLGIERTLMRGLTPP